MEEDHSDLEKESVDGDSKEISVTERIYIGGLDPSRLSGEEIVQRLQSLDSITLKSVICNPDRPFVHLTATSNVSDSSALEIISKKYHNVKWKGCKLAVEKARPHFLDRLKEERKQRQLDNEKLVEQKKAEQEKVEEETKQVTDDEENKDDEADDDNSNEKTSNIAAAQAPSIPRRLRIRRKFGDEAYHVDTKPWSVDRWSFFNKAIVKFRNRADKYQITKRESMKKRAFNQVVPPPLMHRAVHIRFDDDPSASSTKMSQRDEKDDWLRNQEDSDDDSMASIESSDASSSDDNDDSQSEKINSTNKMKGGYAWSDEDESDDDSDDVSEGSGLPMEPSNVEFDDDDDISEESDDHELPVKRRDNKVDEVISDENEGPGLPSEPTNIDEEELDGVGLPSEPSDGDDDDDDDDDNDDDDDDDEVDEGGAEGEEYKGQDNSMKVGHVQTESASNSDDSEDDRSISELKADQQSLKETNTSSHKNDDPASKENGEYQWSSDESSDDDDDNFLQPKTRDRPFKVVSGTDEFDAGLDLNDSDSDSDEEISMNDDTSVERAPIGRTDLGTDVSSNLDILSGLFPEMTETKPAVILDDKESTMNENNSNNRDSQNRTYSAYGTGGIIPRFDPRNEADQKFIVEDEEKVEESDNKSTASNSDDSSVADEDLDDDSQDEKSKDDNLASSEKGEGTDANSEMTPEKLDNVYEEGKLENVFREARDQWAGHAQRVVQTKKSNSAGESGGFSFGFDLGEEPNKPEKDQTSTGGAFSFSFSIPGQEEAKKDASARAEDDSSGPSTDAKMDEDVVVEKEVNEPIRRKGLHIPKDILEDYQSAFFAFNDGAAIAENVEDFRNDERVRETWKAERQSLTLDWKRKKKHAQSRIQKRMKIR